MWLTPVQAECREKIEGGDSFLRWLAGVLESIQGEMPQHSF
jgi:hypothetical protein